ncbi:orotidine-5'-phosphate decarboxylase [Atopostipes suicloacalis DSM 15692]|uniref:Orotidine 5'-phosphate decarboxylase n=1 Tax=Atopostipes suicloacalis DSM 15692 TaxID=1121025 RepID=A0A1M4XTF3_9LACT|nr:orotidine-5'-phosphate decarboxylase [Atopostipes suicloacalis]SHE96670.1 orotidine-5'-phosphate decarboxylase [Atopostipes suicloacalis DSM 15692]
MEKRKPIIALDFNKASEVHAFLTSFGDEKLNIKIGMELFYSSGPDIVIDLIDSNHDIFLDLKLHDIPNTVQKAMKVLAQLGVGMVNVHAQGGRKMMEAAREGLEQGTPPGQTRPRLIAVTQLTSLSEEAFKKEQKSFLSLEESILDYAKLANTAGLDGVVCSPLEAKIIHEEISEKFLTVTPGIRLETKITDDQTRIATPKQAALGGSDYIVVGRPITKAENPFETYQKIQNDWEKTLKEGVQSNDNQ